MKKAILNYLFVCLFFLISACSEKEKPLSPLPEDAVILAFGNSLTYGTGTSREFSYPSILENLTGFKVINAGVPGEISAKGLQRLPNVLDQYQPQLLILIHGGNDILRKIPNQQTEYNLTQMITLARKHGIEVVMLGVPSFNILSLKSAKFYEKVATENRVPINLKILPEIISDNKLKSDSIHPNKQGYQIMAEAIQQLLKDAGAIN
ncbi:MAG: arylesterase [Gammaproteobacteria bacterium]|nr:arylesterase [Gammaproteobacteria bacterium]